MNTSIPSHGAAPVAAPSRAGRWWQEPMMWLVVGGPLAVVIAASATAAIAMRAADTVVLQTPAPTALRPAVQARNHAAAPPPATDAPVKR
ncbi:nitrogen fixation protein FixH [Aquincola sp. S2]|uniref:Nitrogen fixation protein FixH n=1 Tax=Pseudaquabacterium terrae TaxID=2732868 RepID=A0ABX2EQJ4_9BURK|nr:nitrogen fixation protein FixH [Aquabacterium terrae]NRF70967.1 nitrogen fixation protein FixH [Aquabacterium terrae]